MYVAVTMEGRSNTTCYQFDCVSEIIMIYCQKLTVLMIYCSKTSVQDNKVEGCPASAWTSKARKETGFGNCCFLYPLCKQVLHHFFSRKMQDPKNITVNELSSHQLKIFQES